MKFFLPNSLAGRTLAILFVGLTLSHIISILVFTSEKMETTAPTSKQQLLERMAIITRLLRDVPESLYAPIIAIMNRNDVRIRVVHNPEATHEIHDGNNEALRQALEHMIDSHDVHVLKLHSKAWNWNHTFGILHRLLFWIDINIIRSMHSESIDQEWHAWVQLPNRQHILLTSSPEIKQVPLFRHATISVLIMSVAILVFVWVTVWYMARPWKLIIQAAEVFGRDVYAKPLPERGATEVVHAARIFNRMNEQIRTFVEERLRLIAAISHDLRTPLTQLRLLAEFSRSEEDRARMITILGDMEKMFSATLAFAGDTVSTEPKQWLNLSGLLAAICNDRIDAGSLVHYEESDTLPYFCRPVAMKRALINLINNAIQYGGRADVCIEALRDVVEIQIRDPGVGIPEAEWENVMRPFYRLEPSRNQHTGGIGMGLAVVHSVLHDHGGRLQFIRPAEGGFVAKVILDRDGENSATSVDFDGKY